MTLAIGLLIGGCVGVVIGGLLANGAAITRDLDTYNQGVLDGMQRRNDEGRWN